MTHSIRIVVFAMLLGAPAVAQRPTTPSEWPKLGGPWVLVLPDKHIFINPDSLVRRRGDTISVLERIDLVLSDDKYNSTVVSRYYLACDTFSRNERWSKSYGKKGRKPTFTNYVGTLPDWERTTQRVVGGGESTSWRASREICRLATARVTP